MDYGKLQRFAMRHGSCALQKLRLVCPPASGRGNIVTSGSGVFSEMSLIAKEFGLDIILANHN
jgi:hypothetical protein